MRTGRLKVITVLAATAAAACLFAGCKIGEMKPDEYLSQNDAADQCVTYLANGGTFNDIADFTKMDVYYKADSYIMTEAEGFKISRTNYIFEGWYYVEPDESGIVQTLGKRVEVGDRIASGEHKYVIANWNAEIAIDVYLVADGFDVKQTVDGEEVTYKNGDLIATHNFGTSDEYGLSGTQAIKADNATYLHFFADEACTKPITSVTKPAEGVDTNVKVYAKYIEGDWTVVSTARNVYDMFTNAGFGGNYYLFTPDASNVINYGRQTAVSLKTGAFNANIEGNGVTIDGISFTGRVTTGTYSALGNLSKTSSIKNLTLKNVSVDVTVSGRIINLYLFNHGVENGAKIENLKLDTVNMNIVCPQTTIIENIQLIGDVYSTGNWMFGGKNSDDEFIQAMGGISVKDASLTINNKKAVENISK